MISFRVDDWFDAAAEDGVDVADDGVDSAADKDGDEDKSWEYEAEGLAEFVVDLVLDNERFSNNEWFELK